MGNDIKITLEGLLSVIESTKPITINLYNEENLLLITFVMAGFECLDDFLCDDEVTKIKIVNLNTLDITIDTRLDD